MAKSRKLLVYCVIALLAWATPAIAEVVYTTIANIFTANQRVNAGVGINIAPGATGTLSLSSGIFERSRSTMMGEWIAVSYNSANFTASAGTWTVDSGDQIVYAYTLVGKTLILNFEIDTTSVSVTPANLRIAIPGGFTANRDAYSGSLMYFETAAGWKQGGMIAATSGITYIALQGLIGSSTWATATNTTYVRGQIALEIQ